MYKPENTKKLFNLYYLSLENIIEKILGINKQEFKTINNSL